MGKTPTEPEELRREIEQTRAELGETVEALAAKADVKARAHEAADDVRERVHTAVDSVAYQMGKQRERIAKLDPRVKAGLAALVADSERSVLVGAASAGPVGGEVLGALAVAVHAEVPIPRLASMMYAYPTFHRAIQAAITQF